MENHPEKQIQQIAKLIEEIVDENKLGKVVQSVLKSADEIGDGYLAQKLKAAITTDLPKTLNLFIKCAPTNELFRKIMPVRVAYEREVFFYSSVLPKFMEFQSKHIFKKPFQSVPHCYKTSLEENREMLILEDLAVDGYSVSDRFKPLEPNKISLLLTEFAKYHAISFAMKDQELEMYENLTKEIGKVNLQYLTSEAYGRNAHDTMLKNATRIFDAEKDAEHLKRFTKYNETFVDLYLYRDKCAPEYSVISHSDCWNNNYMFKQNDSNELQVKLIDFQLMRVVSPICDVSAFIFTCGSKEIFNNMDFYLNIYYQSLCSSIHALGSDPQKLFSLETFQCQWKKHAGFGVGMCIVWLKIATTQREEVVNIEEDLQKNEALVNSFTRDCASDKLYFERLRSVVDYCIEQNLI